MHPPSEPRRPSTAERVPRRDRPVTLLPDRAEKAAPSAPSDPPRPARQGEDRTARDREVLRDLAVTYRLVRRKGGLLQTSQQSSSIELARRFEHDVGRVLDTLA